MGQIHNNKGDNVGRDKIVNYKLEINWRIIVALLMIFISFIFVYFSIKNKSLQASKKHQASSINDSERNIKSNDELKSDLKSLHKNEDWFSSVYTETSFFKNTLEYENSEYEGEVDLLDVGIATYIVKGVRDCQIYFSGQTLNEMPDVFCFVHIQESEFKKLQKVQEFIKCDSMLPICPDFTADFSKIIIEHSIPCIATSNLSWESSQELHQNFGKYIEWRLYNGKPFGVIWRITEDFNAEYKRKMDNNEIEYSEEEWSKARKPQEKLLVISLNGSVYEKLKIDDNSIEKARKLLDDYLIENKPSDIF